MPHIPRTFAIPALYLCLTASGVAAPATTSKVKVDVAGFDANVKPVLRSTCAGCHNATVTSGGVNLLPYMDASTVMEDRPSWDKIIQKIESGEMPPKGVPKPPQAR